MPAAHSRCSAPPQALGLERYHPLFAEHELDLTCVHAVSAEELAGIGIADRLHQVGAGRFGPGPGPLGQGSRDRAGTCLAAAWLFGSRLSQARPELHRSGCGYTV